MARTLVFFCVPCLAIAAGCGRSDVKHSMTARELKVITDHDARVQAIDEQDTIRFFQQNPPTRRKQSR